MLRIHAAFIAAPHPDLPDLRRAATRIPTCINVSCRSPSSSPAKAARNHNERLNSSAGCTTDIDDVREPALARCEWSPVELLLLNFQSHQLSISCTTDRDPRSSILKVLGRQWITHDFHKMIHSSKPLCRRLGAGQRSEGADQVWDAVQRDSTSKTRRYIAGSLSPACRPCTAPFSLARPIWNARLANRIARARRFFAVDRHEVARTCPVPLASMPARAARRCRAGAVPYVRPR